MIEEFAIEPECLDSYETFKHITDKFDIAKGLVISEFPRGWKKRVWEAYEKSPNFRDVRGATFLEKLFSDSFKSKVFRTGRNFNKGLTNWLSAALESHDDPKQARFDGLIVGSYPDDVKEQYPIYTVEQLWLDSTPLEPDGWRRVPQSPEALASAFSKVLRISREIILVEPHFNPSIKRWREALEHIVDALHRPNVSQPQRFELHMRAGKRDLRTEDYNTEENRTLCLEWLPRCIPSDWKLRVFRWKELKDGEEMHDRFVLTEHVGIAVGRGLAKRDESSGTATFNVANLGRTEAWRYWREALREGSQEFELIGEVVEVTGTRDMGRH